MDLSEAQKQKIEESRARAMAILAKKNQENICQFHTSYGPDNMCTSKGIDVELYETFGEKVCSVCKLHNEDFDLISKSDAVSKYLVTDDSLTTIKHKTRDNPHNPGWTPMKLYLRKHVYSLSIKRFGSLEKLEEEKKERESQKYDRFLLKTSDILSTSTKELKDELNAHPGGTIIAASTNDVDSKRKRTVKPQTESQKRKKIALGSLVSIIRGDQG